MEVDYSEAELLQENSEAEDEENQKLKKFIQKVTPWIRKKHMGEFNKCVSALIGESLTRCDSINVNVDIDIQSLENDCKTKTDEQFKRKIINLISENPKQNAQDNKFRPIHSMSELIELSNLLYRNLCEKEKAIKVNQYELGQVFHYIKLACKKEGFKFSIIIEKKLLLKSNRLYGYVRVHTDYVTDTCYKSF